MANKMIFMATTGRSLTRAEKIEGAWRITTHMKGTPVTCLANDPHRPERVYAGTQSDGLMFSEDSGRTWAPAGLPGVAVRSLAVSPHKAGTIYAGCKPASLYVSRDYGGSWEELEGMRQARRFWWFSPAESDLKPYVQALTISPDNPDVVMAGIELGGVLRSEDGGRTWSKHRRGAVLDCHSLKFHPTNGAWVYEGGGGGASISQDGGLTWRKPKTGMDKKYGWMVAADPIRPEIWYFSASMMPNLLRGEFVPPAHMDGKARASIYRSIGGAALEKLGGGLPEPLDYMPYALITDTQASGHLYAGLASGDIWHTQDYGDSWVQLPLNLGGIQRVMINLSNNHH